MTDRREEARQSWDGADPDRKSVPSLTPDRERVILLECRMEQLRSQLQGARAEADHARARLAEATAREADHARRASLVHQELADARAELAALHQRLERSEALRAEMEGHLFESGAQGDTRELVRLRREIFQERHRAIVNERALARLRGRVEELLSSRETLLTRVAEWQQLVREDGPEAADLSSYLSELRREILDLEHRSSAGEGREAALRERLALAGFDPDDEGTRSEGTAALESPPSADPEVEPFSVPLGTDQAGWREAEDPAVREPATQQSVDEQPSDGQSPDQRSSDERSSDKQPLDERSSDERSPDERSSDEHSSHQRTSDGQPLGRQPGWWGTSSEAPEGEKPVVSEPSGDQPLLEAPRAEGPASHEAESAASVPGDSGAAQPIPEERGALERAAGEADAADRGGQEDGVEEQEVRKTTADLPAAEGAMADPMAEGPVADPGAEGPVAHPEAEGAEPGAGGALSEPPLAGGTAGGAEGREPDPADPILSAPPRVPEAAEPPGGSAGTPQPASPSADTASDSLVTALATADLPALRAELLRRIGRSGQGDLGEAVRPWTEVSDPPVRAAAYEALGRLLERDPGALEPDIRSGLADPDARVRRRVVLAAATARGLPLRSLLDPLREDPDPQVRRVVREVLRHVPPAEAGADPRPDRHRLNLTVSGTVP